MTAFAALVLAMQTAPTAPDALPLRDVHLPSSPAWWPPAPGWWMVFAALALIAAAWWWRRRRSHRQRIAIEALFDGSIDAVDGASARIAAMSELLRRASRNRDPRADRLSGDEWLRFLDADRRMPMFSAGVGRTLLEGGFRRDVGEQEYAALRDIVRVRFVELMTQRPRRRWPWSRRRA
jgi:hypothetical protein